MKTGVLENLLPFWDKDTLAEIKEESPLRWVKAMNNKGIVLCGLKKFSEAAGAFAEAITLADEPWKCKILINAARNSFLSGESAGASKLLIRAYDILASGAMREKASLLGHLHFLKGEMLYQGGNRSRAWDEFRKADHSFDGAMDNLGIGRSCVELARIHIAENHLLSAWNCLKKAESRLKGYGPEEALGVMVCKAVAFYHSGKIEEAQRMLGQIYQLYEEFGQGKYALPQILDAYLDIHSRTTKYVIDHGLR